MAIDHDILERQTRDGWGAKVADRLVHDLRTAFLDMQGFPPGDLKYMCGLYAGPRPPSDHQIGQPEQAEQLPLVLRHAFVANLAMAK